MFLGLRMTAGVSCEEFRRLFGQDMEEVYGDVIHKNIRDGLLEILDGLSAKRWMQQIRPGKRLALTERGLDLSNYVMAQFLL